MTTASDRHAPPQPASRAATTVSAFLAALEARDLATAEALLAPGATMTFPGGVAFRHLDELVEWSRTRYRFVRKRFERIEEIDAGDGRATVYCLGTLHGEWPDGRAFAGVRFVDRFEIRDGRIVAQQVWNDLAEARAAASR